MESDSTPSFAVINNHSRDLSEFGPLAEDARQVAASLTPIQFVHVPRSCNKVAHILAKFVVSIGNEIV